MANTEHSTITDPFVHEPKNITSASSGQVYVADGASSGNWTFVKSTDVVIVESASDLPDDVAGVITLAANTVYQIVGNIDIGGDRLVVSDGTVVRGVNQDYDKITSSTTGVMVTSTNVSVRFIQVGLTCSSGTLLDVDGTGTESFDFIRVSATCDSIGDIDNMDNTDIFRCGITAASTGLTFTGAHGGMEITQSSIAVTATNGTCLDLQTATFGNLHLTDVEFSNPTGTGYGLDVAAGGANLDANIIGHVGSCDFTNRSNATNYVEGDDQWYIVASPGMPPSIAKAQGYVDGNATANTFGGGVGVPEVVAFGTSFVGDIADKFTISNAGRFTYNGIIDTTAIVSITARVTMGGGASRVRNMYVAKNGSEITSSIQSKSLDGTNEGTFTCSSIVSLSTNDYIEAFIEAETATTSTTVDTCSITVTQIAQ